MCAHRLGVPARERFQSGMSLALSPLLSVFLLNISQGSSTGLPCPWMASFYQDNLSGARQAVRVKSHHLHWGSVDALCSPDLLFPPPWQVPFGASGPAFFPHMGWTSETALLVVLRQSTSGRSCRSCLEKRRSDSDVVVPSA